MDIMDYIRSELERQRTSRGMTQRQQAEQIGWTENEMSRWLRSPRPTLGKLSQVAGLIGLDLPSLIKRVYRTVNAA
jgi:transcriptional regulator with XRE-family HTH domain